MPWHGQILLEDNFLKISKIENLLRFTSDQPLVAESFRTNKNLDIDIIYLKKTKKLPKNINFILTETDLAIQNIFANNKNAKIQPGYCLKPTLTTIEQTMTSREYKTDFSSLFHDSQDLGEPRQAGNLGYKPKNDVEWLESFDGIILNNFKFKASIFLNQDFSGGHTTFPIQKYDIEPKLGRLLIHPYSRDYIYGVRHVKDGARFVLNFHYELLKNN